MPEPSTKTVNWKYVGAFLFLAAFWIVGWLWKERHDAALLKAVIAGDVQAARQAFNDGATMQMHIRRDFTFLQIAAREGSVEMARLLVEHGAQATVTATNQDGDTALEIALANGRLEMADLFEVLDDERSEKCALAKSVE